MSKLNNSPSVTMPATRARYPQWRPITSSTKQRWWLCAVGMIASATSRMRWSAESVPIVMSVPQKSLSMDPTMPTMFSWECRAATSWLMLPLATSSLIQEMLSNFSTLTFVRSD